VPVVRVSVLLTCFQHLAYLPAALDSVRVQTYRDIEIIAIDDGSTDGTRDYLRRQPDLVTIFNPQNLGTYGSLNVALEAAQGEFVAILNDDDVWKPEKLAHQVRMMDEQPEVALVHTGGQFIDGKGHRREGNPLGFAWPTFRTGDALELLVYENKIIASAALARTAVLRELGGFNELYFGSGDWEMWFRVAERHALGFVPDELTQYRVHGANASHKLERIWRDDERLREFIQARLDHWREEGRFDEPTYHRLSAFNRAALGTVKMLNGKVAESRAEYRASLFHDPKRWKTYARWVLTGSPALFRRWI